MYGLPQKILFNADKVQKSTVSGMRMSAFFYFWDASIAHYNTLC